VKLEILGCSGGIGKGLKTTTFLLDKTLLIDAGTGVERMTMEQMLQIRTVVISHAHLDHIAGLPLMLATIYDQHRHPLDVYALPEVIEALRQHIFNWTIWPDYTQLPEDRPILRLHPLTNGQQLETDYHQLTLIPATHPTPTTGFLVSDGNARFVFTGDTGCNDALWPLLNQSPPDLIIIDVSFTDDLQELARLSGHLTPSQAAQQLQQLDTPCAVRITHLKPGFEAEIVQRCQHLLPDWDIRALQHNEVLEITEPVME